MHNNKSEFQRLTEVEVQGYGSNTKIISSKKMTFEDIATTEIIAHVCNYLSVRDIATIPLINNTLNPRFKEILTEKSLAQHRNRKRN